MKRISIYLDTCIFLKWLKKDYNGDSALEAAVNYFVRRFDSKQVRLVTSTITLAEVLEGKFETEKDRESFRAIFKRENTDLVAVTPKIAKRASELRFSVQAELLELGSNKKLHVPDAIHLATALEMQVDALYTTDNGKWKKSYGLLPLNGTHHAPGLKICLPEDPPNSLL